MQVAGLLLPFILLGIGVIFVAFSGGPGSARETYLTRGGRGLRILAPLLFLALGVLIPAIILVSRDEKAGGTPQLASAELTPEMARGKDLFRANCASCHALAAINARGVTGPNLDEIGAVNRERILAAIRNGGTGQNRMPADIVEGENAEAVADYVSRVAGR